MKRGVKSLAVLAKQHISICCKTLCDREIVEEYIKQLEDQLAELPERRSLGPDMEGNNTPIRKLVRRLTYGHLYGGSDESLERLVYNYVQEIKS